MKNKSTLLLVCFAILTISSFPQAIPMFDKIGSENILKNIGLENEIFKIGNEKNEQIVVIDSAFCLSTSGDESKQIFSYDASMLLISDVTYERSGSSGSWDPQNKISYSYDASRNLITKIKQKFGTGSGNWMNFDKDTYTYDSFGNMLSTVHQEWDGAQTGVWENVRMFNFTYNSSGNMTSSVFLDWSESTEEWDNLMKSTTEYNGSGSIISQISQNWSGGNWVNEYKAIFDYDSLGNKTSRISQNWLGSSWQNSGIEIYTYDSHGFLTSLIHQNWEGYWKNDWKRTFTNDSSGNLLSTLAQDWDYMLGEYVNSAKFDYTYDTPGNVTSLIYLDWDEENSIWVNFWKFEYLHNYDMQTIIGYCYEWIDEWVPDDNHIILELFDQRLYAADCHQLYIYYSSLTTNTTTIENTNQNFCYPNPASNGININNPFETKVELKVYNISGQLLKNVSLAKGVNSLSVEDFPKGFYLFTIQSENKLVRNKVLVN